MLSKKILQRLLSDDAFLKMDYFIHFRKVGVEGIPSKFLMGLVDLKQILDFKLLPLKKNSESIAFPF